MASLAAAAASATLCVQAQYAWVWRMAGSRTTSKKLCAAAALSSRSFWQAWTDSIHVAASASRVCESMTVVNK